MKLALGLQRGEPRQEGRNVQKADDIWHDTRLNGRQWTDDQWPRFGSAKQPRLPDSMKNGPQLSTLVRTLLSVGFRIASTQRKPSYIALTAVRRDEFGVENKYVFACVEETCALSDEDVGSLQKNAEFEHGALVIVGRLSSAIKEVSVLTTQEFLGRLGGPVLALLPLEPDFPNRLSILGHNALPPGLSGNPDTLFEEYVHAGLQFILQDRVVRYGQDRRFEAVPDGLVAGHRSPLMLYDAKAAKDGYEISANSIRQFGDYVRAFHSRYEAFTGHLYAFLLVSGHFQVEGSLEERSAQLFADCNVPLRTIASDEMAKIVGLLAERPAQRQVIDWKAIFARTVITVDDFKRNLEARVRDGVISN